jgi:hypothetical protein
MVDTNSRNKRFDAADVERSSTGGAGLPKPGVLLEDAHFA